MLRRLKSGITSRLMAWADGGSGRRANTPQFRRSINDDLRSSSDDEARALLKTVPREHRFELRPARSRLAGASPTASSAT